jgi:hypothetical protein
VSSRHNNLQGGGQQPNFDTASALRNHFAV